jgi:uncharacterized Zn finger protein
MDDKQGHFVEVPKEAIIDIKKKLDSAISDVEKQEYISHLDGIFFVGEKLEIKGSKFEIRAIHTSRLVLKLLPKVEGDK